MQQPSRHILVLGGTTEAGLDLGAAVAARALATVRDTLREAPVVAEVVVVDRAGGVLARA